MSPALAPGDRLLVVRARRVRRGDVVLAPDPRDRRREIVKRVVAVSASGAILRGDNPAASTDARTFGAVPVHDVRWRAALRYWPPGRIGRVARAPRAGVTRGAATPAEPRTRRSPTAAG